MTVLVSMREYVKLITNMINIILDTGVVPDEWKNVIIAIVPKPGDRRECSNSRGISLISHLGKVFEICIHQRVQKIFDNIINSINETQFGSMKGKGIDDALLISTMITGSSLERNLNLYKCYIDLKKAYDRVSRKILFKILEKRGTPPKLLRLIKALHEGVFAQVKVDGELTEGIELKMGVKQGGVLSGILWSIYMAAIIDEVQKRFRLNNIQGIILKYNCDGNVVNINDLKEQVCLEKQMYEILYVDDWMIFSTSMKELQLMLDIINDVVEIFLQEVSISKTKYMRVIRCEEKMEDKINLTIKGEIVEEVKEFKYLGVHESYDGKMDVEIEKRIICMRIAYGKYKANIFKNKYLSMKDKLALYNTFVSTVGLYGSATWCITEALILKLDALNFKFLRSIVPGMTRMSSYEDIILKAAEYGVAIITMDCLLKKRLLRFVGHIQRMKNTNIQKQVLHSRLREGMQGRGAPPMNYRQAITKALRSYGINSQDWIKMVQDKYQWYKFIEL